MSESAVESALAHRSDRGGAPGLSLRMREVNDRAMIDVRGLTSERKFLAGVQEVLGFALPRAPRASASTDDVTALWLSVDQWLITTPRGRGPALAEGLQEKLKGSHCLIADMSDARAIFRLEGDNVREVLNKGTSVDFTSGEHGAGSVRRILFAQIAAMVHVVSAHPDVMDFYVFRSYADYVWRYLLTTGRASARIRLFGRQTPPA